MAESTSDDRETTDPFFHVPAGPGASEWNACIGPQGSEENYVDGFMEAAIEISIAVIDRKLYAKRDTLVLPALYNARHAVELSLKYVLRVLYEAEVISAAPDKHHDILKHWNALKVAARCDEALRNDTEELGRYVLSLARVDNDGQELRYHEKQDGQRSLEGQSLANFVVIHKSLIALSKLLSRMQYRVRDYLDERRTGCFTNECSRNDLLTIAKMLPRESQWNTPAFNDAKNAVKKRFALDSNKKFIKAIDAIKRGRETRAAIGLETPLAHLRDESAVFLIQQWHRLQSPREKDDGWQHETIEEMMAQGQIKIDVLNAIIRTLTPDEIADFETIFYLARDKYLCDHYDRLIAETKAEYVAEEVLFENVAHLMSKLNLLECMERGIRILGRPTLADQLLTIEPIQGYIAR